MTAPTRHSATNERTKPRRRVDGELKEGIEVYAFRGWKAPAIHAELLKQFGEERTPNLRTIQRWVNRVTPQDPTGPWRLADADDPADAALILPFIAIVRVEGVEHRPLTKGEAEWVLRIRKSAPDVPLYAVLHLVWTYQRWTEMDRPTELLDVVLAAQPWRSRAVHQALEREMANYGEDGQSAFGMAKRIEQQRILEGFGTGRFALSVGKLEASDDMPEEQSQQKEDKDDARAHPTEGQQVERRARRGTRRKRTP